MKTLIRVILIIILAIGAKIAMDKIIWKGTTKSQRLKNALNEAVASNSAVQSMTKKIFNPGEFYLLVPDSKINYETTKEQYLDSVLIHHTFSIKAGRVGETHQ